MNEKEAKRLVYVARALIRRNAPLEDIRLILDIPQVNVLVYKAFTPQKRKELLSLAENVNHTDLLDYLSHLLTTNPKENNRNLAPLKNLNQSIEPFSTKMDSSLAFFNQKNNQKQNNCTSINYRP